MASTASPSSSALSSLPPRTADVAHAWALLEQLTDPEIPVVTLSELGILRDVRSGAAGLEVVITPLTAAVPPWVKLKTM